MRWKEKVATGYFSLNLKWFYCKYQTIYYNQTAALIGISLRQNLFHLMLEGKQWKWRK
jgi:hypothetical protein